VVIASWFADHKRRLKKVLAQAYSTMEMYTKLVARRRLSSASSQSDVESEPTSPFDDVESTGSADRYFSADEEEDDIEGEAQETVTSKEPSPAASEVNNERASLEAVAPELAVREQEEVEELAELHRSILEQALDRAQRGEISVRRDRTVLLGCASKEDFLARLDCIRTASTLMLSRPEVRDWFQDTGRTLMTKVCGQYVHFLQSLH
jgi:hypothetical protein